MIRAKYRMWEQIHPGNGAHAYVWHDCWLISTEIKDGYVHAIVGKAQDDKVGGMTLELVKQPDLRIFPRTQIPLF